MRRDRPFPGQGRSVPECTVGKTTLDPTNQPLGFTEKQTAQMLGCSVGLLRKLRRNAGGPPGRLVRYYSPGARMRAGG